MDKAKLMADIGTALEKHIEELWELTVTDFLVCSILKSLIST